MKTPSFLTLTLLHNDEPLHEQVARAKRSFAALRRRKVWKSLVRGGYWCLEIERNGITRRWHVHVHAIIDAHYLPQAWLADEWEAITGDSRIVWIRRSRPQDARYTAKYTAKCSGGTKLQSWELWPYAEELHHTRDCGTFGTVPPLTSDDPAPNSNLTYLGSVSRILYAAENGERWATDLLPILSEALECNIYDCFRQPRPPT